MFTSKSHGEFNDAFNDLACTRGVTYCGPWNLSVSNGREFMNQSYDTVGRIYASELLHNSAGGPLAGASEGHAHFTPMQRAALQQQANDENGSENKEQRPCRWREILPLFGGVVIGGGGGGGLRGAVTRGGRAHLWRRARVGNRRRDAAVGRDLM